MRDLRFTFTWLRFSNVSQRNTRRPRDSKLQQQAVKLYRLFQWRDGETFSTMAVNTDGPSSGNATWCKLCLVIVLLFFPWQCFKISACSAVWVVVQRPANTPWFIDIISPNPIFSTLALKHGYNNKIHILTFYNTMPATFCASLFLAWIHYTVYRSHLLCCHTYFLYTHTGVSLTASILNTYIQCAGH